MVNVKLNAYRANEITFVNRKTANKPVEMQTKFSYNVKYAQNGNCQGEMTVEILDKNEPEVFRIKVVMTGVFKFKEAPREELHKETFNALFPYVRSLVTTVSANAGIPPIIIPFIDIESQSIYKIEKPEN